MHHKKGTIVLREGQFSNESFFVLKGCIRTYNGIYFDAFVVNIPYERLMQLNGKRVRISGKITVVSGIQQHGKGVVRQGRRKDQKHLVHPSIKVISGTPQQ